MVTNDWFIFLSGVLMLKVIYDWHMRFKRREAAKVRRLRKINHILSKQIERTCRNEK
ncbi:MAG: hypothetical protein LKJ25_08690 [Clostridia bacterium]|jgi:hypothetical protein|nr:hypothetical protein [Clostridia bacterium]